MMEVGESAIQWALEQCAEGAHGCRWIKHALGLTGDAGCFWTDLVGCAQDCGSPPLITVDSSTLGGWDCILAPRHWQPKRANLMAMTLTAWSGLAANDPRHFLVQAVRITRVRNLAGHSLWQADNAGNRLGFYRRDVYETGMPGDAFMWREHRPDHTEGAPPVNNSWPGWNPYAEECSVLDVDCYTPDGTLLGSAIVLFLALGW